MAEKSYLDSIKVPEPCNKSWDKMIGDDQKRFCLNCEKDVYNLSAMTKREARKLVAGNAGKICVRYARLPNGKLYTTDTQLHQITRKTSTIAAGVIATTLTLSAISYAQGEAVTHKVKTKDKEITEQIIDKKSKTEIGTSQISFTVSDIMGSVIPEAKVKLISEKSKQEFVVLTNKEGIAYFSSLNIGRYKAEISADYFDKQEIYIQITQKLEPNINVNLEVSGISVVVGIFVEDKKYEIPFFQAIVQEDIKTLQTSIASGFDVNTKDKNGVTALHVAVESGNFEIVKLIINSGADVNAKTTSKLTPLWMILETDADEETGKKIFDLLISKGADINATNENKETLLMLASEEGSLEAVKTFLEAGAKPNLKDKNGKTALMKTDNAEIKELLRRYGGIK